MSRAKEIISKKIISPIRSVGKSMPKLFSVGLISLLGLMPLASLPNRGIMAYAQQQAQALDPWSEALRTAQSKVEAATTPGAFGHGVPGLYDMTPQDILLVFGVAAMGSILVYATVNHLLNRSKERATKSDQLVASAA
ncbi:MAG: hypothetical protein M3M87_05655 [Thermoproteota archaeon]|nr:hypothetical protein [Thermoproteota archaeon]